MGSKLRTICKAVTVMIIIGLILNNILLWDLNYSLQEQIATLNSRDMNIVDNQRGFLDILTSHEMQINLTFNALAETIQVLDTKEDQIRNQVQDNIDSVVHIYCYQENGGWQGSGVIIKENGLIVTAAHVIGEPGQAYTITLNNGKQYITEMACSLEGYDIGFIKIEAEEVLPVSKLGDFNDMFLGDTVYAIGSPWGYEHFNSVSKGVVSSLNRSITELAGWEVLWQTDCTGNPGNSGCPVYNVKGEIVGIFVGSYTMSGGYDGIIYCVPSNIVIEYMNKVDNLFNVIENLEGISI